MAKTPFKLRSGNVTPFKMMGSSPAKDTEPHTGKGGHKHTKEELGFKKYDIQEDESIDITREGIGTTTTPATVTPGKPVEKIAKPGTPEYDRWLAAVKADPSIEEKYKPKTIPGTTTTEDISTTETVEKPTREQRYRYERPQLSSGERRKMTNEDYANWLNTEGFTKDKRGNYRRRSTTGKGILYNPEMVDISEKEGFDYSGIDYKDPTGRQFKNANERKEFMDYQKTLKKAQSQKKYKK